MTAADSARDPFAIPASDDGLPGTGPIRRENEFQENWRERRTLWSTQVAQDQGAVVFLGDSIVQCWGDALPAAFPGLKIANRGISGDTSRGVLLRLKDDVLALHPAAVVVLIGTNDLEEDAPLEGIAANLRLIVTQLERSDPRLPIVVCQVFPSGAVQGRPAATIKRLNALCLAALQGDARITLLETWPLFADAQGDAIAAEFPDSLHPNDAGYAKWAAALRPVFAGLGLLETAPDSFAPPEGFVSLFNGRDLSGWSAAESPAGGAAATPAPSPATEPAGNGWITARHGRLVLAAPVQAPRITRLQTTRSFSGDFTLQLEFRATPHAAGAVSVLGFQLPCADYALAGPYRHLKHHRPQNWNTLEVSVRRGVARCTCNGEVLESAAKLPAAGPLGLECRRGQLEFRHLQIKGLAAAEGNSAG